MQARYTLTGTRKTGITLRRNGRAQALCASPTTAQRLLMACKQAEQEVPVVRLRRSVHPHGTTRSVYVTCSDCTSDIEMGASLMDDEGRHFCETGCARHYYDAHVWIDEDD